MRAMDMRKSLWRKAVVVVSIGSTLALSGCQVDINGQTLPSPWYQKDDVQYFPPGPEFKLTREAAAQKAFADAEAAEAR